MAQNTTITKHIARCIQKGTKPFWLLSFIPSFLFNKLNFFIHQCFGGYTKSIFHFIGCLSKFSKRLVLPTHRPKLFSKMSAWLTKKQPLPTGSRLLLTKILTLPTPRLILLTGKRTFFTGIRILLTGSQPWATNGQGLATDGEHWLLMRNHRLPVANHCLPVRNHSPPVCKLGILVGNGTCHYAGTHT